MLLLGSVVLISVVVIPIIMLFICLDKLLVLFLSGVETLVIVSGAQPGRRFTRSSGLIYFVMNLIHYMWLEGFG